MVEVKPIDRTAAAMTSFPASVDASRLHAAWEATRAALLAERHRDGFWLGELSPSALSTATAVIALDRVRKCSEDGPAFSPIYSGVAWLIANQNADGGWGDTVKSDSNVATTMLCRAALHATLGCCSAVSTAGFEGRVNSHRTAIERAEFWLRKRFGRTPEQLAEAVRRRYGVDRTFAVPILATCAVVGLVSWKEVQPLPFELACLPQSWFRFLRLHVVSYALPALIAIGQCVHYHRPTWNPVARCVRGLARRPSLDVLRRIQPSSGGYLEATPLTSFVVIGLASIGQHDHPVVRQGVRFLVDSIRPDGSWPIDTNLSTWLTTLAVNGLAVGGAAKRLDGGERVVKWLNDQQFRVTHPYTGAAPGGWGWTPLPGSVPDADDTAGALLASANLCQHYACTRSARAGIRWLLSLQNRDGGWPTFCRGWGRLPFDRSGADLTAHVLRALSVWARRLGKTTMARRPDDAQHGENRPECTATLLAAMRRARQRGLRYLCQTQRADGSWLPLWFGNQHVPNDENPTYGTARVLAAYRDLDMMNAKPAERAVQWLIRNQNSDFGWSGAKGAPSSIEETSLALEVLQDAGPNAATAVNKGLAWLVDQVEAGRLQDPVPIGFYFAKLWYFERLYPLTFAVAALGKTVQRACAANGESGEISTSEESP